MPLLAANWPDEQSASPTKIFSHQWGKPVSKDMATLTKQDNTVQVQRLSEKKESISFGSSYAIVQSLKQNIWKQRV